MRVMNQVGVLVRSRIQKSCKPALAASVAGIIKLNKAGYFKPGDKIVCTLTGNGLKDPDTAMQGIATPVTIDATQDVACRILEA